jgi:hypothetical protein
MVVSCMLKNWMEKWDISWKYHGNIMGYYRDIWLWKYYENIMEVGRTYENLTIII